MFGDGGHIRWAEYTRHPPGIKRPPRPPQRPTFASLPTADPKAVEKHSVHSAFSTAAASSPLSILLRPSM